MRARRAIAQGDGALCIVVTGEHHVGVERRRSHAGHALQPVAQPAQKIKPRDSVGRYLEKVEQMARAGRS